MFPDSPGLPALPPPATPADTEQRLLDRRRLLLGSAALAGSAVVGGVALTRDPGPVGPWRGALVEAPADESDLPRWRADLDILADQGLNLVRTGVPAWLVAPDPESWDRNAARTYRHALDDARTRGLGVNLVVPGAPDWAQPYDRDRYLSACTWFWTAMADSFDHQVMLWQAFNEADASHYQRFTSLTPDTEYLGQLNELLSVAHDVLGRYRTPVTTNLTGWPLGDEREQGWRRVLDTIGGSLDVISLDLYPADDLTQITLLADRIGRVRDHYQMPVFVAEIGLQTGPRSWSEQEQRQYLPLAIDELRNAEPWGVCLYRLRDDRSSAGFGITRADGSAKPAYGDVLRSLARR